MAFAQAEAEAMTSLHLVSEPLDRELVLRSPDAVVTAVPYLLGFMPTESIVIVWVAAGTIALTQRIDLPDANLTPDESKNFAASVVSSALQAEAESAVVCIFTDRGDGTDLPYLDLVAGLMVAMHGAGIQTSDALLVSSEAEHLANRWWSYLCTSGCCPPEGRDVDERVALGIRAKFALLGVAAMESREGLEKSLDSDALAAGRVALLVKKQFEGSNAEIDPKEAESAVEEWRQVCIPFVLDVLTAARNQDHLDEAQCAHLLLGLADVRVRDTFLWHLAREADRHGILAVLLDSLRKAPVGLVAPVATVAAICAWLLGDGARALIALDRAEDDDPGYSLAELVRYSLSCGMPPKIWLAAMNDLTEDQCRSGKLTPPLSTE